ncbi:hypothetical protein ACFL5Y_03695, partial [Candidatus Omnitrophota bacterium]
QNLFNISLTRYDYEYYKKSKSSFGVRNYTSFIDKEAPLYKITAKLDENIDDLDHYRGQMAKFYECSFKRDKVFLKNIQYSDVIPAEAGIHNSKTTILITGGFHTENLSELFKKNNISYISIMPNFENGDGYESPYFKLLSGEQNKIFAALSSSESSLATFSPFSAGAGEINGVATSEAIGQLEKRVEGGVRKKKPLPPLEEIVGAREEASSKDATGKAATETVVTGVGSWFTKLKFKFLGFQINIDWESNAWWAETFLPFSPLFAVLGALLVFSISPVLFIMAIAIAPAAVAVPAVIFQLGHVDWNSVKEDIKKMGVLRHIREIAKNGLPLKAHVSEQLVDLLSVYKLLIGVISIGFSFISIPAALSVLTVLATALAFKHQSENLRSANAYKDEKEKLVRMRLVLKYIKFVVKQLERRRAETAGSYSALLSLIAWRDFEGKQDADDINELWRDANKQNLFNGEILNLISQAKKQNQDKKETGIYNVENWKKMKEIAEKRTSKLDRNLAKKLAVFEERAENTRAQDLYRIEGFMHAILRIAIMVVVVPVAFMALLASFPTQMKATSETSAAQVVDYSMRPKQNRDKGKNEKRKISQNWDSAEMIAIGDMGTSPMLQGLGSKEAVVAELLEGKVFTPLFQGIWFNVRGGMISPPKRLVFSGKGQIQGQARFRYRTPVSGKKRFFSQHHVTGIVTHAVVRPIDKEGNYTSDKEIKSRIVDGWRVDFEHEGRVEIIVTITDYEGVSLDYEQEPLPESEIRDFPPTFAMEIISNIRNILATSKELSDKDKLDKFAELVDREGLSLRQKLDLIAEADFISSQVKVQAIYDVIRKHTAYNGTTATVEYDDRSWGSTWQSVIDSGNRTRVVCRGLVGMGAIMSQRLGLRAGFVPHLSLKLKEGHLVTGIPHADMIVLNDNGQWKITKMDIPIDPGGVPGSGVDTVEFEGEVEATESDSVVNLSDPEADKDWTDPAKRSLEEAMAKEAREEADALEAKLKKAEEDSKKMDLLESQADEKYKKALAEKANLKFKEPTSDEESQEMLETDEDWSDPAESSLEEAMVKRAEKDSKEMDSMAREADEISREAQDEGTDLEFEAPTADEEFQDMIATHVKAQENANKFRKEAIDASKRAKKAREKVAKLKAEAEKVNSEAMELEARVKEARGEIFKQAGIDVEEFIIREGDSSEVVFSKLGRIVSLMALVVVLLLMLNPKNMNRKLLRKAKKIVGSENLSKLKGLPLILVPGLAAVLMPLLEVLVSFYEEMIAQVRSKFPKDEIDRRLDLVDVNRVKIVEKENMRVVEKMDLFLIARMIARQRPMVYAVNFKELRVILHDKKIDIDNLIKTIKEKGIVEDVASKLEIIAELCEIKNIHSCKPKAIIAFLEMLKGIL